MAITLPLDATFNSQTEEASIPQSDPLGDGSIDGVDPALYTYGKWDSDVPNPTAGMPPSSGGIAAKGVMGDTNLPEGGELTGFQCAFDQGYDGVTVTYYLYMTSAFDVNTSPLGEGIKYIKLLKFGDTETGSMFSVKGPYNMHDVTWWRDTTAPYTLGSLGLRYFGTVETSWPVSAWAPSGNGTPDLLYDEWVKIKIYVKFGTYDTEDGIVRVWINDVLYWNLENWCLNRVSGCDGLMHWCRPNYHMNNHNDHTYPLNAEFWLDDLHIEAEGGPGSAPIAAYVRPRSGPLTGYNTVQIKGSNFLGATNVYFDGIPSFALNVENDETISCQPPAGRADATSVDVIVENAGGTSTIASAYEYLDDGSGRIDDHFTSGTLGANWSEVQNGDGELEHYDATTWCLRRAADYDPGSGDDALAIFTGSLDSDHKVVLYGLRDGTGHANIYGLLRASGATWNDLDAYTFRYTTYSPSLTYGVFFKLENGAWTAARSYTDADTLPDAFRIEIQCIGQNFYVRVVDNSQADGLVFTATYNMSYGFTGTGGFGFVGSSYFSNDSYGIRLDRLMLVDATSVSTPPTVTSINPTSGAAAGGTSVTITGTGFLASPSVDFYVDGTWVSAANIVRGSATEITCDSPAGVGGENSLVRVTNTDGFYDYAPSSFGYFLYTSSPTITSVTPSSGSTVGGEALYIQGTQFQEGAIVYIDTTQVSEENTLIVTSELIIVSTPPHAAGTVDVRVVNPDQEEVTDTDAYTYVEPTSRVISHLRQLRAILITSGLEDL